MKIKKVLDKAYYFFIVYDIINFFLLTNLIYYPCPVFANFISDVYWINFFARTKKLKSFTLVIIVYILSDIIALIRYYGGYYAT